MNGEPKFMSYLEWKDANQEVAPEEICESCDGTGEWVMYDEECPDCHGTGKITKKMRYEEQLKRDRRAWEQFTRSSQEWRHG